MSISTINNLISALIVKKHNINICFIKDFNKEKFQGLILKLFENINGFGEWLLDEGNYNKIISIASEEQKIKFEAMRLQAQREKEKKKVEKSMSEQDKQAAQKELEEATLELIKNKLKKPISAMSASIKGITSNIDKGNKIFGQDVAKSKAFTEEVSIGKEPAKSDYLDDILNALDVVEYNEMCKYYFDNNNRSIPFSLAVLAEILKILAKKPQDMNKPVLGTHKNPLAGLDSNIFTHTTSLRQALCDSQKTKLLISDQSSYLKIILDYMTFDQISFLLSDIILKGENAKFDLSLLVYLAGRKDNENFKNLSPSLFEYIVSQDRANQEIAFGARYLEHLNNQKTSGQENSDMYMTKIVKVASPEQIALFEKMAKELRNPSQFGPANKPAGYVEQVDVPVDVRPTKLESIKAHFIKNKYRYAGASALAVLTYIANKKYKILPRVLAKFNPKYRAAVAV